MSWGDNWLYPDRADKNDDGRVDSWEQSEADYEYDAVMGTNISGGFPERDRSNLSFDDDDDFFDDEYDEDEKAERYADELYFDPITEVDNNGYWDNDGEYHLWKIKDFVNDYDENGYWDKCGDYHDFEENPKEGYWMGGLYTPFRQDYNCYYDKTNRKYLLKAEGFWMDNICYIKGINGQHFIGAVMNQKFYSYSLYGDWKKYHDYVNDRELNYQVSMDKKTYVDTNFTKRADHFPCYEGVIGYWDWDDEILYIYEEGSLEKIIGYIEDRKFYPYNCSEKKVLLNTTSDQNNKNCEPDKNNLLSDIEPFFSEPQKDIETKICFSKTAAGRMFAAAYDQFPELENYLTPKDLEEGFSTLTGKVYSKNRPLAADCWSWIVTNYADKLLDDPDFDHLTDEYFRYIPGNMSFADDEDRHKFIQHYIAERAELMEILFSKVPYDSNDTVLFELLGWSIVRNDFAFFEKAYFMLLNNKKWVSAPPKKEDILDGALTYRESFARNQSSEKFYVFFREEIKTVEHAGKRQHLNDILRHKLSYGFPFAKPSTDLQYNQILQDIPSIKDNVPAENISQKPAQCKKAASAAETVHNEKAPEEKAAAAVIERNADINTELHILYERKRVLKEMIAEIDIKIEKLESFGATEDKFFTNAEVVGMKYYDCSDGELVIGTKLTLVRDLENEYDSNAVAVYDDKNRKVGFITKRTNAPLARGLDNGRKLYAKVSSTPVPDHYPNMKIEIFESK